MDGENSRISGGDTPGGHTRTHPEHEAHACVGLVKPRAADGTILETVWESRRLPENMGA